MSRPAAGVFVLSFGLMLYELSLTRVLSVLYYYHTAVRSTIVPGSADYFFQDGIRGQGFQPIFSQSAQSFNGMHRRRRRKITW